MSYNVYGVGNALVDMEYQVSEQQLQALDIEKGVMTLVELQQQRQIIKNLGLHNAQKGSGGSAANSMIAIAQLGGTSYYACCVADDELGSFYLQDLADAGVASRSDNTAEQDLPTGTCLVMITPDADRTMNTYLGVSSSFSTADINIDAIKQSEYLYIEGYLVTGDNSREAAIYARQHAEQHGVKTAISLSDPNMVSFFKAGLLEMIGDGVDLLFSNEDEAKGMADTDDLEQALAYLQTLAKNVVVTRGAEGAVILTDNSTLHVPAAETNLLDTNGAGDMFAGTYLYAITNGYSAQQAAELAAKTAAKLVSQYGARLDKESIMQAAGING